jgi:hypothetical protein
VSTVACDGWRPKDEDDTFQVQDAKEVWFMNWDLQERGFECLVEHHDIERVTF